VVRENLHRTCPLHDGLLHLTGVDYDLIRPGCVLPRGGDLSGSTVTSVEIYGPGNHPPSPPRGYAPPEDYTLVLYRTRSAETKDAWVEPEWADTIGSRWTA
jgi:hypothetical protein